MNTQTKDKLFTPNFIAACSANFLYFFGFYSLLPIMALYLIDTFQSSEYTTGVILSIYTIAALTIRPFGGYLVDKMSRKTLYIISLSVFVLCFAGYPLAGSLFIFVLFRILHGLSFGTLTVSANTLVIDISPASRRGEGLGIYGIANTTAMAFGPMAAVYLYHAYGYNTVFYTAFGLGLVAFIIGSFIKAPKHQKAEHMPLSWDRFILFKGLPAGAVLFLLGIPYGMMTSYIALYSKELGLGDNTGWFYSLFAVGIIFSRIFSGKQTDRGYLTRVITIGTSLCSLALLILSSSKYGQLISPMLTAILFNGAAFIVGLGYGSVFPAMNTLFVNLAPHDKRGTANSTYMTTWDIGIGLGLFFSNKIASMFDFSFVFLLGTIAAILSIIIFEVFTKGHYNRNKLH